MSGVKKRQNKDQLRPQSGKTTIRKDETRTKQNETMTKQDENDET